MASEIKAGDMVDMTITRERPMTVSGYKVKAVSVERDMAWLEGVARPVSLSILVKHDADRAV